MCGATVGALQQKASHGSFVSLALVPCVARTTQHSTVSCASASGFLIGFVLKQCFQHFSNQRRETCRILSASLTKIFASRSDAANNGFQVMGYHGWLSLLLRESRVRFVCCVKTRQQWQWPYRAFLSALFDNHSNHIATRRHTKAK